MKLLFIGSGSAFTTGGNFHSNMLLQNAQGQCILLDCGTDARHALSEQGVSYQKVDHVYISHLHADHAGGLEWLGFTRKFDPNVQLCNLYISETLVKAVWENTLAGGMRSIEHVNSELATYFQVHAVAEKDRYFIWQDVRFDLVQVEHVYNNETQMPCFGLQYQIGDKIIWWTADLMFKPDALQQHYQQAHLIFHDCETAKHPSGVHPHYTDLLKLPPEIRKKMWLYHYHPGDLPDAVKDGFRGFVKKGQEFDLLDPKTYK